MSAHKNESRLPIGESSDHSLYALQSHLLATWTQKRVDQYYRNTFLAFLDQLSEEEAKEEITKEQKLMLENRSQYNRIKQFLDSREAILQEIRTKVKSESRIEDLCTNLDDLRKINLGFCEQVLRMKEILTRKDVNTSPICQGYLKIFQRLDTDNQIIKKSYLSSYISFARGYDPFFLVPYEHYQKNGFLPETPKCVMKLFTMNISYVYRLIKAKNQLLNFLCSSSMQETIDPSFGFDSPPISQQRPTSLTKIEEDDEEDQSRVPSGLQMETPKTEKKKIFKHKARSLKKPEGRYQSRNIKQESFKASKSLQPLHQEQRNELILPKIPGRKSHSISSKITSKKQPQNSRKLSERRERGATLTQHQQSEDQSDQYRKILIRNHFGNKERAPENYYQNETTDNDINLLKRRYSTLDEQSSIQNFRLRKRPAKLSIKQPGSKFVNQRQQDQNERDDRDQSSIAATSRNNQESNRSFQPQQFQNNHYLGRIKKQEYDQATLKGNKPFLRRIVPRKQFNQQFETEKKPQINNKSEHGQGKLRSSKFSIPFYPQSLGENPSQNNQERIPIKKSERELLDDKNRQLEERQRALAYKQKMIERQLQKKQLPNQKQDFISKERDNFRGEKREWSPARRDPDYSFTQSPENQHNEKQVNLNPRIKGKNQQIFANNDRKRQKQAIVKKQIEDLVNKQQQQRQMEKDNEKIPIAKENGQSLHYPLANFNSPSQNRTTQTRKQHENQYRDNRQWTSSQSAKKNEPMDQAANKKEEFQPSKRNNSMMSQSYKFQNKVPGRQGGDQAMVGDKRGNAWEQGEPAMVGDKRGNAWEQGEPAMTQANLRPNNTQKITHQNNQFNRAKQHLPPSTSGNNNLKQDVAISGTKAERKQIKMKPSNITIKELIQFIKSSKIHKEYRRQFEHNMWQQALTSRHCYFAQFYIDDNLVCFGVSAPLYTGDYQMLYWGVMDHVSSQKLKTTLIKKYLQYLEKYTALQKIYTKSSAFVDIGFTKGSHMYVRNRLSIQKKQLKLNNFLSIECSNICFQQSQKDFSILYSEQIPGFTHKNATVAPSIAFCKKEQKQDLGTKIKYKDGLESLLAVNNVLDEEGIDTYECSNDLNVGSCKLMAMNELFLAVTPFYFQNGYFISEGEEFEQNGERIFRMLTHANSYTIWFGKNFDDVEKFVKTCGRAVQSSGGWRKKAFGFKIFSRQLYGRLKNPQFECAGCYGNWDITFAWQNQLKGIVKKPMPCEQYLLGSQGFFISLFYQKKLLYALKVDSNDFFF